MHALFCREFEIFSYTWICFHEANGFSFYLFQVKVWFQNRRTKHKRQQQEGEDGEGGKGDGEKEGLVLEHEEEEEEELDVLEETSQG